MQVLIINHISELVAKLKENPVLSYTCGFKVIGRVPSESTFSRFKNKISDSSVLEDLFTKLVEKANALKLVDGEHISIDSTKLGSFEASKSKKKIIDDGSNPNCGMKRDTNGNNIRWFGWKLHIICDSKSELPLDILVTPANVYDGTLAVTMIESFLKKFQSRFKPKYYPIGSGYDFESVNDDIINIFNAIPIIAYNPRGSNSSTEVLDEDFNPLCSGCFKLAYWGKDSDYL